MQSMAFRKNEALGLFSRLAKLRPSVIFTTYTLEEDDESPADDPLFADAKKREVFDQARTEVLEHIRRVR